MNKQTKTPTNITNHTFFNQDKRVNKEINGLFESSSIITRPTPPMVKQWTNGIYDYNNNYIKNLPVADNITYKLIKNFFTAKPLAYNNKGKKTRLIIRRLFRSSLNNILVSKPEIKHYSDVISINVFLYDKKQRSLLKKQIEKNRDLDYSLNQPLDYGLISNNTENGYFSDKIRSPINKSSDKRKLYKAIPFKRNKKHKFISIKHKWNTYRTSIWESEQQLLGLKLKRKNTFKTIALSINKPVALNSLKNSNLKSIDNSVALKKILPLKFINNIKSKPLNNKPNTKQYKRNKINYFNHYVKVQNIIACKLDTANSSLREKLFRVKSLKYNQVNTDHIGAISLNNNILHSSKLLQLLINLKNMGLQIKNNMPKNKGIFTNKAQILKLLSLKTWDNTSLNSNINIANTRLEQGRATKNFYKNITLKKINKRGKHAFKPQNLNAKGLNYYFKSIFEVKNLPYLEIISNKINIFSDLLNKIIYTYKVKNYTLKKKLGKTRRLRLKPHFTKFNLNLFALIWYMSKKGYKLDQILEKINTLIISYLKVLNYLYKKNQIIKNISSQKDIFNRKNKRYNTNKKSNYKTVGLKRYPLNKNTVQPINSKKIIKPFKKHSVISQMHPNDITSKYTSNILGLFSNIINRGSINLLYTPLKNSIKLKTKGLYNYKRNNKYPNIIDTPLNKIQLIGLSSKLIGLKSKSYLSKAMPLLISIYVKGRKLSYYEKNYINKFFINSTKHNIAKLANKFYLYKKNIDFLNKLIVNKYLGYKPVYKVALVNKYNNVSSKYSPNRNNKQRYPIKAINSNQINRGLGFKRILVKKYKLINKHLNITQTNNRVTFNQLKIINKNIIIQKKINKINKFITKYIGLYLENNLNQSVTYNQNNIQKLKTKNFVNFMKDKYILNYLKDILTKEIIYINYIKMLCFNNTLYKSWFLIPLKSIISKLYNKQIVFNFINLKYIYFNSDLLTQAIVLKLKNIRKNSLHRVLKKVLNLVLVTKLNIYVQNTISPTYKYIDQHYNKYKYINNLIFKPNNNLNQKTLSEAVKYQENIETIGLNNNTVKDYTNKKLKTVNNDKNNFLPLSLKWLNHIQTSTINFIKYKSVFGLKLEAAGRLTKRSTASRAVFKFKFKGNLKNNYTMTRDINPRIKGLNLISNIQYTKLGSKTRNGSFGIKTWINNN